LLEVAANVATVIGFIYAAIQFKQGRVATSAAILISINESFRQAWIRFCEADGSEEAAQAAFADVMNLIEAASAVQRGGTLIGHSGRLLTEYLCAILTLIENSPDALRRIEVMVYSKTTFRNTQFFIRRNRSLIRLERIMPSEK
jgi:hypothetical protein